MNKKSIVLVFFSVMLLAASCRTTQFSNRVVTVNGMIYDFSNRPVPYCDISLGKRFNSSTDINGRFILPRVPYGEYTVTASKNGYETYIDEIYINNRNQIIYIRIPSQNQLLELVDEALTRNNLTTAEEILERASLIDQNNIEMLFYYATVKFRQQNYDSAIAYLEYAKRLGSRDVYIDRFLNMLKEMQNDE